MTVDLDDVRPVWRNVAGRCRACGHEGIATQHSVCPPDDAECPGCGAMCWCVTHYAISGALVPRLERVR